MNNYDSPIATPITTGGPAYKATNGTEWRRAPEDPILLHRTEHVRLPRETMLEFHARTGLGASQIRTMSLEEIAHFVAVVTNPRRGEDAQWGGGFWLPPSERAAPPVPKVVPRKFSITE
jgi:hypothetical protein